MEIQQAAVCHPQLEEITQFDLWERLTLSLLRAKWRRALTAAPSVSEFLVPGQSCNSGDMDPPFGIAVPRASEAMCPRVSCFHGEFFCQSCLLAFMQSITPCDIGSSCKCNNLLSNLDDLISNKRASQGSSLCTSNFHTFNNLLQEPDK